MRAYESSVCIWRKVLRCLVLATVLTAAVASPGRADEYLHLAMGNQSKATEDVSNKDNLLMKKDFFALSYNNSKGRPNWVSWRLIHDDLGDAPRKPFYPDKTLPEGFVRVTPKDYVGFGFDRGHQCPHSDRSADDEMSHATFVMTNIIPQSPNVNQKAWAELEGYCRDFGG